METYIVGKIIIQTMRDIWYTVSRANLKVCFFLIKYKEHSDSFQKEQLWNSRNISLEQYHSSFCPRGGSQRHLSTHFTTVNAKSFANKSKHVLIIVFLRSAEVLMSSLFSSWQRTFRNVFGLTGRTQGGTQSWGHWPAFQLQKMCSRAEERRGLWVV